MMSIETGDCWYFSGKDEEGRGLSDACGFSPKAS
jgi:hypothetical protein